MFSVYVVVMSVLSSLCFELFCLYVVRFCCLFVGAACIVIVPLFVVVCVFVVCCVVCLL